MPRELQPCGTLAAYRRHVRAEEIPCTPCLEAKREANRRYEASRSPRPSRPRALKPCGTRAAYARHLRNGEKACDACLAAEAAGTSSRVRPGRGRAPLQPCGTYAAYQRHVRNGEEPCGPCREAARVNAREATRRQRALPPVEVPRVVQGPAGVGPCAVAANGFLWDPVRDDETPAEARERQRVAAAICRTACPVFAWCYESAPRVAGVVAGVRS